MHTHRNTSRNLTLRSPDSAESVAQTSAGKQNTMARAHQQPRKDISKMRFPMARTKAQHTKTVDITILVTFQRLTHDYHCEGRTTNTMTRTKRCACHQKWTLTSPMCCACHEKRSVKLREGANLLRLSHKTSFDTLAEMLTCHRMPHL